MGSRDGNKSPNMCIWTVLPILFLTGLDLRCLLYIGSSPDQKLVTYTREIWMARAGTWLLAHCILHYAQVNRVENGLNGA